MGVYDAPEISISVPAAEQGMRLMGGSSEGLRNDKERQMDLQQLQSTIESFTFGDPSSPLMRHTYAASTVTCLPEVACLSCVAPQKTNKCVDVYAGVCAGVCACSDHVKQSNFQMSENHYNVQVQASCTCVPSSVLH